MRINFDYDPAGRRIRRSATVTGIAETPIEASYGPDNRLATLSIAGTAWTLSHDANGNLTGKTAAGGASTLYGWDADDRLVSIDAPGLNARFRYDALGRRLEKTVNGQSVQYLYDGAQAIAEIRNGAIDAQLLTGLAIDEAIARYDGQGERTLLTDALGSVLIEAKADGTVATAYGYSPYGETQAFGEASGNASQYTGRENDGTGLYYYRARYYDPQLKRFISEDPIGLAGGVNTYLYVGGQPLRSIDPMGLSSAVVDRSTNRITVNFDDGTTVTYPAGNNTINPSGNPDVVGSNGPAPAGVWPVQPPVSTTGRIEYGDYFWPIGSVGPNGERLDIARQRGIGLHCGRRNHQSRTEGCVRMDNPDCSDLYNRTLGDPLTTIEIR